uniref:ECL1/2/3 zinc binding protein n=1 Tax=virus sp. ct5rm7 TaxID=2827298 RepID=A0A8S5RFS5_9VIRU|nr:MAG TPA: ECL1/2/3 zinc binding protein [virus sp. ct5rm7]
MNTINDLQTAARNILLNNGLTELSLGETDELRDPTYIIWYDNDCQPYDDPVQKVCIEENGIAVELYARDFGNTVTVYDYDIDRIEWWEGIRANMLEVLECDGRRRCPACGRPLKQKRKYCSGDCRKLMAPEPTVEQVVAEANRNIRRLAGLAAGKDKAYKKRLIEKYTVGLS